MTAEIVDVFIAVHIPFPRAFRVVHVNAVGVGMAGIMSDAARKGLARGRGKFSGFLRALAIGGDDFRIGQKAIRHRYLRDRREISFINLSYHIFTANEKDEISDSDFHLNLNLS